MNFRTESLDFPQNEQRRCLSCDMTAHSTRVMRTPKPPIEAAIGRGIRPAGERVLKRIKGPAPAKQETTEVRERFSPPGRPYDVRALGFRPAKPACREPP